MFSDKTVPPPSENRRSVSSDSDYLLRAVNQFQVEQDILPQLNGSSFRNRYIAIRQGIFTNFPNVLGENVSQSAKAGKLISEYRVEDSMSFTPYYAASEAAMANFEPHIDRWYQQLAQLPPGKEKTAAVYRFLSVIVLGGIQIHPGSEGNGQTFRLLALSYLHDLIPDTNNCFFPIKYQAGGDNLPTSQNAADISIQQLANDFPPLTPTDPQEQTLLDTFRFANKIS